jgi:ethanolamine utilization protein EutP
VRDSLLKRTILIGRTGSGKTTLVQRVENGRIRDEKTQMVVYHGSFIDTPGKYVEMRGMYRALIVTAADADTIALVHACTDEETWFPPQFASIFPKEVIGVVTKADMASSGGDAGRSAGFLRLAGAGRIFTVSAMTGDGLDELTDFLRERPGEVTVSCATNY